MAVNQFGNSGSHGNLTGLGNDDHPQYLNETRGDARYLTQVSGDARYRPLESTRTVRIPHTWAISGDVKVASGAVDYIMPFSVPTVTGQTAEVVGFGTSIYQGTSATVRLHEMDTGGMRLMIGQYTSSPTYTVGAITPTALGTNARLVLEVTAISNTPKNLSFTVFIDYTF